MEVTELLRQAQAGDREALNQVIPLLYLELKKIAAYHLRRENGGDKLQTTALVHEAYMRLASANPAYENRSHFCGVASHVMRQVLVDQARARGAAKRGAGCEINMAELGDLGQQRGQEVWLGRGLGGGQEVAERRFGGRWVPEVPQLVEVGQGRGLALGRASVGGLSRA